MQPNRPIGIACGHAERGKPLQVSKASGGREMWRACGGCHAHLPVGHLVQWMRLLTTPALAQLGVTWPSSAVQKGEVTVALPYRCRVVHPTPDVFPAFCLSEGLTLSREFTLGALPDALKNIDAYGEFPLRAGLDARVLEQANPNADYPATRRDERILDPG
ncbi:hypothetical protein ACQUKP_01110 [Ralstonia pseudosolanacearum]|uniref:hypothetical protein n=1 Tax=Ralstonia pseudosolanacearum TaxID=1310165 RepID=UPI003A897AFF